MANSDLEGKTYGIPPEVKKEVNNLLHQIQNRETNGYKRLMRISSLNSLSYDDFKNIIKASKIDPIVSKCEKLLTWVNNTLNNERNAIDQRKKIKSTLNFSNQYKNKNVSKNMFEFKEVKRIFIVSEEIFKIIKND